MASVIQQTNVGGHKFFIVSVLFDFCLHYSPINVTTLTYSMRQAFLTKMAWINEILINSQMLALIT